MTKNYIKLINVTFNNTLYPFIWGDAPSWPAGPVIVSDV